MAPTHPSTSTQKKSSSVNGVRKHVKYAPKIGAETVKLLVGEDQKPFAVHRDLIAKSSDFFRKALNGPFKEKNGLVRLPTHKLEAVETYIKWLYTGIIFSERDDVQSDSTASPPDVSATSTNPTNASEATMSRPNAPGTTAVIAEYNLIFDLLVLGEFLQDRVFRNAVVDALIETTDEGEHPLGLAAGVYSGLPKHSPVRRLLVDFWIWAGDADWYTPYTGPIEGEGPDLDCAPRQFWLDVAKGMTLSDKALHDDDTDYPWVVDRCQYHEHLEGEPKCT